MHAVVNTARQIIADGWTQYQQHNESVKTQQVQSGQWSGDEAFVVPALDAGVKPLLEAPESFSDSELAAAISLGWIHLADLPMARRMSIPASSNAEDQLAFLARFSAK